MRWLLISIGLLAVVAALAFVAGWMLPVRHVASGSAAFAVPPEVIWNAITEVDAFPAWRRDVKKVQRLPDRDGRTAWVEDGQSGRLTFVVDRHAAPTTLVTRIADPDLPFGGSWTYEIARTAGGSTLTITENGEIYNPVFRLLARFAFGYEATLAEYLKSLEKRVSGERGQVQD
jgi:uncharacterized protein YndB with AHSA1/START domain